MRSQTIYYSLFWSANSKTRKAPGKHDGHHYQKYLSDTWAQIPFRHKRYFSVLRRGSLIAPMCQRASDWFQSLSRTQSLNSFEAWLGVLNYFIQQCHVKATGFKRILYKTYKTCKAFQRLGTGFWAYYRERKWNTRYKAKS